jgi:hypothetical protein
MRLTELTVYYISILTIPAASVGFPTGSPPTTRRTTAFPCGARRETSSNANQLKIHFIMSLLAALQVQSSPSAPYIIIAFIAFTAALYCVPTLFRFFKNLSNPAQRAAQPADDTVYVCHDEAFLQPKA